MTRFLVALTLSLLPVLATADVVTPARTIRVGTIIVSGDLVVKPGDVAGAFDRVADVSGQEARTTLYAGRPIKLNDIGPPALVERNQIVSIRFESKGLMITTEGRSLQRGGVGDRIRIMNLSSRATLFGHVQKDGSIRVFQ